MNEEIRQALLTFVVDNFLFGEAGRMPAAEESLTESGVIDSTGVLELIEFLESRFGVEVTEAETVPDNLDSIAALARFVSGKVGVAESVA